MPALVRRLLWVTLVLAGLVLLPFVLLGEDFDLSAMRGHPLRVALVGIGLLVADVVLPVPASAVFAALGAILGPLAGAVVGTLGSMLSGILAYGVARLGSRRFLARLADPVEVEAFRAWFNRWGGLAVAGGRALPVLPEVSCVLAGLGAMAPARFLPALTLGSAANAIAYAALGSWLPPMAALPIAVAVPVLLWLLVLRRRGNP